MEYKVVMYKTPICGKCQATLGQMSKVFPEDLIEINVMDPKTGANMDFADEMRDKGLTHSPFVFIKDEDGNVVDSWNDFQFKKIQKWVNKLS